MELNQILIALTESKAPPTQAPNHPGLYAIYGSPEVWDELGLGVPPDDRPLYVGKAEKSLLGRDVKQHFGTGATGSSTVRRSLAALLKSKHGYTAVPRNLSNPGHYSNFGLRAADCSRLTVWMQRNLLLGTWVPDEATDLDSWETQVLRTWVPPLNLSKVKSPWAKRLKKLRKIMAEEARRYEAQSDGPTLYKDDHLASLLNIGFQKVGSWSLVDGLPRCTITALHKRINVLYAFISDGEVLYLGKSSRTLEKRLKNYHSPGPTQRTNVRNHRLIRELLEEGAEVDILAWADEGKLSYGPFRINLAAGLEDSIISVLNPKWNGLRGKELKL